MTDLRPSPRQLGLEFPGTPGTTNSIVDVADVSVGYWHHDGLNSEGRPVRTGVTAILPMGDAPLLYACPAAIHSQNGNGEMTGSHWIRDSGRMSSPVLITNTHAVGAAHSGAVAWMVECVKNTSIASQPIQRTIPVLSFYNLYNNQSQILAICL